MWCPLDRAALGPKLMKMTTAMDLMLVHEEAKTKTLRLEHASECRILER